MYFCNGSHEYICASANTAYFHSYKWCIYNLLLCDPVIIIAKPMLILVANLNCLKILCVFVFYAPVKNFSLISRQSVELWWRKLECQVITFGKGTDKLFLHYDVSLVEMRGAVICKHILQTTKAPKRGCKSRSNSLILYMDLTIILAI